MNKFLIFIMIAFWGVSCSAQKSSPRKIQEFVQEFVSDSNFYTAGIGIVISDVESGKILAHNQAHLGLIPASTQKLITTTTALELFGAHYQFTTNIETDGSITKQGVLTGNIIIHGNGDPTLGSKYFYPEKNAIASLFVKQLREKGIKSIDGNIIIDDTYLKASIPPSWIWEDIGNYYGAIPHGINYLDNLYTLYFKSGKPGNLTQITRTDPPQLDLQFENKVISSAENRDLAYIFGGNISNQRIIEGSIPKNKTDFAVKGAMLSPKTYLLEDLEKACMKSNITIQHRIIKAQIKTPLFEFNSPELKEIVRITNQKSVNLFADHLLFEIGHSKLGEADWETGIKAIKYYWKEKGLSTNFIRLCDGSGLSHYNLVTAQFFDQLLRYMYKSKLRNEFISSLPVAGKSGTLKYFGKNTPLEGKWKSKTGSMTGVRTFCGYISNKKGKVLAVTILINNYTSLHSLNNKLQKLLIQLYNS
ncbi:D-alanyl-D-alanine carboxypeptidase/D-alanyl-D-alanine endopeptidase [Ancylomarina longa]|uniref:D-alanyl-D-alanine carboxypeptidase/D-alanyl-D-alanine-endopeptidase n=1 Tax=Ancylomarina longa TaxID=2487017 RepID=A0A434AGP2_9BACT|nr:D-alanyl-D-alanine carboxypeptidase/D-alanyl-D-alanine-endopeptidase [Ancylomarina longa]RUT73551.1 D-alanyl-D-alanine carboxypeptidase/D-alanyl-D-alanine-endopeptidase [Ancylomarina longa]